MCSILQKSSVKFGFVAVAFIVVSCGHDFPASVPAYPEAKYCVYTDLKDESVCKDIGKDFSEIDCDDVDGVVNLGACSIEEPQE